MEQGRPGRAWIDRSAILAALLSRVREAGAEATLRLDHRRSPAGSISTAVAQVHLGSERARKVKSSVPRLRFLRLRSGRAVAAQDARWTPKTENATPRPKLPNHPGMIQFFRGCSNCISP